MIVADRRQSELAQIHIAKKQLAMAEDTYRNLLRTIGRVSSARDLDYAGRQRLLEHFRACGFKPAAPKRSRPSDPAWDWVNHATPERQALLRKIAVLLKDAEREKTYADGIAKRMFGIDLIEFCFPEQLQRVVSALVYDARRREKSGHSIQGRTDG